MCGVVKCAALLNVHSCVCTIQQILTKTRESRKSIPVQKKGSGICRSNEFVRARACNDVITHGRQTAYRHTGTRAAGEDVDEQGVRSLF